MKSNRGKDTIPELALRSALHRRGLRFRLNRRPLPNRRRTVDISFQAEKVAVFLDGCFWHGCPEHHSLSATNTDFWQRKVTENRERDAETTRMLQAQGWVVLRFWEHEDVEVAAQRVAEIVAARRQEVGKYVRPDSQIPERQAGPESSGALP